MADENSNSGVNTILIVLVLIIVVGLVIWFFNGGFGVPNAAPEDNNLDVEVDVPTNGDIGGEGGA